MMKKLLVTLIVTLVWSAAVFAEGTQYRMRVDGLACPYCAYGVEKNMKKIEGVRKIEFDLNRGLVLVNVAAGVTLTEEQMIGLFKDAGFTYRSMSSVPLDETNVP